MRATQNPQYVVVGLAFTDSSMQINLRQVHEIKQLKRRLQVVLAGGAQLVQVTESKQELEAAIERYKRIRDDCQAHGGLILRDSRGNPSARLFVNEEGDLQRERIVQEQPGTFRG